MNKVLRKLSMLSLALALSTAACSKTVEPKMMLSGSFHLDSKGVQIDISSDLYSGLKSYYYYSLNPGYYPYNGTLYYWDGYYWYNVDYLPGWYRYCGGYYWWDGYRYTHVWYNNQSMPL